jgi:hypothetical protein
MRRRFAFLAILTSMPMKIGFSTHATLLSFTFVRLPDLFFSLAAQFIAPIRLGNATVLIHLAHAAQQSGPQTNNAFDTTIPHLWQLSLAEP